MLNDDQAQRLRIARKLKKFGHLQTWKELYIYQRSGVPKEQIIRIASYAKRKNNGEVIVLPLMEQAKIDDKEIAYMKV